MDIDGAINLVQQLDQDDFQIEKTIYNDSLFYIKLAKSGTLIEITVKEKK